VCCGSFSNGDGCSFLGHFLKMKKRRRIKEGLKIILLRRSSFKSLSQTQRSASRYGGKIPRCALSLLEMEMSVLLRPFSKNEKERRIEGPNIIVLRRSC
jgi:hypothetical protein